jgi:DNA-binding beta-propeller fold protein YncE
MAIAGSPFATAGLGSASVAVDPTGKFVYVANFGVGNVSGYTIQPAFGSLTAVGGSPFAAGSGPRSVAVSRPQ